MRYPSFVLGTLLSPLRPSDLSTTSACCIRIYFVSMTSFSITSPALEATHPQKKTTNRQIIKFSPSWQEMTSPLPVIMSNTQNPPNPRRIFLRLACVVPCRILLPYLLPSSPPSSYLWQVVAPHFYDLLALAPATNFIMAAGNFADECRRKGK